MNMEIIMISSGGLVVNQHGWDLLAGHNINELLEELKRTYHHLRQSGIDEEKFDVISGF